MPNTPLTQRSGTLLVRLVIACMAVQLVFLGYVFYQSYAGREDLVHSQRTGCARSLLDRQANADGWRIAEAARRADGQTDVANRYSKIAEGLEMRSRIDCAEAFPSAGILP